MIDHDGLIVWRAEVSDSFQALANGAASVKSAHYDRYSRPCFFGSERNFLERFSNNAKSLLRLSCTTRQTKIPVVDVLATSVPFVGPSIDKCPRAACGEGLSYLPVQVSSLRLASIPVAVESDFRYQQRTIACEVLQPREIGLIFVLRL